MCFAMAFLQSPTAVLLKIKPEPLETPQSTVQPTNLVGWLIKSSRLSLWNLQIVGMVLHGAKQEFKKLLDLVAEA